MTRRTRSARNVAAGCVAVLAFSLGACGGDSGDSGDSPGDDGPPTDASQADYCEVINDPAYFEDLDADSEDQEIVDAIQAIADDLREVGTPEDIPDDARDGFEIQLDAVDDLEADDIAVEGEEDPLLAGLSDADKEKVEAYRAYETETCPDETDIGTPDEPEPSIS
ncbi:hypothetical protein [Nocardioides bizhenqiangii]|uniref:DUF732 domain-containing protein n=1 Tax=Nocardioides bizhenqiangii TaxID=3095076 RepID=A0ABZ0ZQ68_9ACTN|nr:hypothetical protein [Nocardioides sp. HM61]WQQ26428.1 hypothetical protein SHK19_21040 [Nocardioides sp. HM61]